MTAIDSLTELTSLLETWGKNDSSGTDQISVLERVAALIEKETESWYKMDPDPFDDRHPGRADPNCTLGHFLKALFKNENFMNKITSVYLHGQRDQHKLHTVSCRLLLNMMPGLETSVVFSDNETLVKKLINWTEHADGPLRYYATGLLASSMEIQDIAAQFKDDNARLVPLLLKRLHELKKQAGTETTSGASGEVKTRPFANVGQKNGEMIFQHKDPNTPLVTVTKESKEDEKETMTDVQQIPPFDGGGDRKRKENTPKMIKMAEKIHRSSSKKPLLLSPRREMSLHDASNSSWAELQPLVIGSYCMHPLGIEMQQRLILQYLAPMGEYQELLCHVFEHNAMELIFYYIDLNQNRDVRLSFEALKYLSALLCHKKFAVEFIQEGGVQKLLEVYRPSVAATGVSMCLYYLAYFEDAFERVCLLPHTVIEELVTYVLWLLECSHESGRCHATMFFSMAFPFRVILELFDAKDGLRKLYNVISTLQILNTEEVENLDLTEDETFTSRQAARHGCVALKRYFETHLGIKADSIRRSHTRNEGGSPIAEIQAYKAAKYPCEVVQDNIELLLECLPFRMKWTPVTELTKLGGVTLLIQMIAMATEWSSYAGRAETIKSALDVIAVCSVTPKVQLLLCDTVSLPGDYSTPAISILLGLAEGEIIPDPEVQRAALHTIINCVCAPSSRYNSSSVGRYIGLSGSVKKKMNLKSGDDLLSKLWSTVRSNNGIMVLLRLLSSKVPITEVDLTRALACKALFGLSRSATVKQIVSKLPLFNNGQLQQLMKEPILQDKRQEHIKFCKYANAVIEMVSGKPQNANIDASLDRIRKADVVAQTKIIYQEKELLELINSHLLAKGLTETATVLQKEANLPKCTIPTVNLPSSPCIYSTPNSTSKLSRQSLASLPGPSGITPASVNRSLKDNSSSPSTPLGPLKLNISRRQQGQTFVNAQSRMLQTKRIIQQKQEAIAGPSAQQSPVVRRQNTDKGVSLDKIVTEYLREQHALCPNPVVTCPPFSLQTPHRCPDPKHKRSAPTNITARMFQRHIQPRFGGPDGYKCDRKYVYRKFKPIQSYRDPDEGGCFSSCAFSACEQFLMCGTYAGELKLFNIHTAEESANYVCHNSPVTHCEPSRDGKLVLTSSSWGQPLSAIWSMGDLFDMKTSFEDDNYLEFSKNVQDRIVGTKEEKAHIYDVATGRKMMTLFDQDLANHYTRNRATFNPSDELVLNDGVLWDVNSGKSIYKFDKFNPNISGVFHPSGLEIIINSEVWDLRNFHLVHTVPALDQCQIRFNHTGTVIYGAIHQFDDDDDLDDERIKSPFGSSFRTFDAFDYTNIATIDVKKNIFDLCTDSTDCYLAVIENQRSPESLADESICRMYEVGRRKDDDEDQNEEEEEEDEGMDDDDDDDDDDEDDDDDDNDNDGSDSLIISGDSDMDHWETDDDNDDDLDDVMFELSDDIL